MCFDVRRISLFSLFRHTKIMIEHSCWRSLNLLIFFSNDVIIFLVIRCSHFVIVTPLLLGLEFPTHQIVDESLTSIQVGSQVIAYLNKSVSLLLELYELVLFLGQLRSQLPNLLLILLVLLSVLGLFIDRTFYFLYDCLHVILHLLNHLFEHLVFLID